MVGTQNAFPCSQLIFFIDYDSTTSCNLEISTILLKLVVYWSQKILIIITV